MIKFSLRVPHFIAKWLFPNVLRRASIHGEASSSRRSKRGVFEATVTAREP